MSESEEKKKQEQANSEGVGDVLEELADVATQFAINAASTTTEMVGSCAEGVGCALGGLAECAGDILSGIGDGL